VPTGTLLAVWNSTPPQVHFGLLPAQAELDNRFATGATVNVWEILPKRSYDSGRGEAGGPQQLAFSGCANHHRELTAGNQPLQPGKTGVPWRRTPLVSV
jgi:hypothetical protein